MVTNPQMLENHEMSVMEIYNCVWLMYSFDKHFSLLLLWCYSFAGQKWRLEQVHKQNEN